MKDLSGKKFGRFTVIRRLAKDNYGAYKWLCLCDCGKEKEIRGSHLVSGHTASCGCIYGGGNSRRHGHTVGKKATKTYSTWEHMIRRCHKPEDKDYSNYGGRGIHVCLRWMLFDNFLADMGESPEGLQLDRIDNNAGYSSKNCRWVTPIINNRNRRNNRLFTTNGETKCVAAWAQQYGVNYGKLWRKLCLKNEPLDEALAAVCQQQDLEISSQRNAKNMVSDARKRGIEVEVIGH